MRATLPEWGTPVLYSRAPDGRLFDRTDRGRISEVGRKAAEEADRKTQKEDTGRKPKSANCGYQRSGPVRPARWEKRLGRRPARRAPASGR